MILDTNALSAWAEGNRGIEPVLRSAKRLIVPVVVLGEFEFGIRLSRYERRYADWLETNIDRVEVASIDYPVAKVYAAVRRELKKAGTPIPVNDTWIAAIARHLTVAIVSRDTHFDMVQGIERISW